MAHVVICTNELSAQEYDFDDDELAMSWWNPVLEAEEFGGSHITAVRTLSLRLVVFAAITPVVFSHKVMGGMSPRFKRRTGPY